MHLKIFTDGGARGNPGPAAIGIVIQDGDGNVVKKTHQYLGEKTNNQAEYTAVITALQLAKEIGGDELACYSDSELLVRQLNGLYQVRNEALKKLFEKVKQLCAGFESVKFTHVRRSNPGIAQADGLVNECLDAR